MKGIITWSVFPRWLLTELCLYILLKMVLHPSLNPSFVNFDNLVIVTFFNRLKKFLNNFIVSFLFKHWKEEAGHCGLIRHVLDREVAILNLAAINYSFGNKSADWRRDTRDENWTCKHSHITLSSERRKRIGLEEERGRDWNRTWTNLLQVCVAPSNYSQ